MRQVIRKNYSLPHDGQSLDINVLMDSVIAAVFQGQA
jgi:hypothetical protein